MKEKALLDSRTRSLGRSAQCNVDDVSGPKLSVTHSLLIPMLIYTREFVPPGPVSDIASRRPFALPAVYSNAKCLRFSRASLTFKYKSMMRIHILYHADIYTKYLSIHAGTGSRFKR